MKHHSIGFFLALVVCSGVATATEDLCVPVTVATILIEENTRLTCDTVCNVETGPCFRFARDNVKLFLNGHRITGQADPPAVRCELPAGLPPPQPQPLFRPVDGISTAGFDHVEIIGPGLVQRFPRHGIFMTGSDKSAVRQVTSHHNCYSGIFMGGVTDSDIEENVSVRNGSASQHLPCGGNCITNSSGNRIRRNEFSGNGSVVPGNEVFGPPGKPNDFGVGLVFNSDNNVIEENAIGGNINGLLIFPEANGNLIRRNVIAGNPPIQVSVSFGPPVGVDIRDSSPAGANTFEENLCITYEGVTVPDPCAVLPKFAGHKNTSQSSSRNTP